MITHEIDSCQLRSSSMLPLKLNNVGRRFHVKQDNVSRSTNETARSLLTPKKQTSLQKRLTDRSKVTDNVKTRSNGIKMSTIELSVTSLRVNKLKSDNRLEEYVQNKEHSPQDNADNKSSDIPQNILRDHSLKEETVPERSILAFINQQGDRNDSDEKCSLVKLPASKLSNIRSNKDNRRQAIKTTLVDVGCEDTNVYSRHNRDAYRQQINNKYSYYQNSASDTENAKIIKKLYNTAHNETNVRESADSVTNSPCKKDNLYVDVVDKKKTFVSVTPLLFSPPLAQKVPYSNSSGIDSTIVSSNNSTASTSDNGMFMSVSKNSLIPPTSSRSEATNTGQFSSTNSVTVQVKTVRLEVFSERRQMKVPRNIHVGQTSCYTTAYK